MKTFSYFTLTAGRGKEKIIKRGKKRGEKGHFSMMQINISNSEAKKTEATNA